MSEIKYKKGKCYRCGAEIILKKTKGFWRIGLCENCGNIVRPVLVEELKK